MLSPIGGAKTYNAGEHLSSHLKDTPYLLLKGQLWGVYHGYFEEELAYYNPTTLYCQEN